MSNELSSEKNCSRREYLKKTLLLTSTFVATNAGIYIVGAAFRELDGSLVAGAKSCPSPGPTINCPPLRPICGSLDCDPSTGAWIDSRYCADLGPECPF